MSHAPNRETYRPRWWHRWLAVDLTWAGLPIVGGRTEGFLTRRVAMARARRARRFHIEMRVIRRG